MRSTGFATRLVGVLLASSPLLVHAGLTIPPGFHATVIHETPPGTLAGGLAVDSANGDIVFGAGTNLYRWKLPYTGAVERAATLPANVNVAALASIGGEVYAGLGKSYAFPFPHEVGQVTGGTYTKLFDLDGVYDFDSDLSGNLYIVANPGGAGTQIQRYNGGTRDVLGTIGGYSGGVAAEAGLGLFYADPNLSRIAAYPAAALTPGGLVSGVASMLVGNVYGSYLSLGWENDLLAVLDFGNTLARYSLVDGARLETIATDPAFGYGIGKSVQSFYNGDIALIFSDFSTFNSRIVSLRRVKEPHDIAGAHRASFALHNARSGSWRFVDVRSNTLTEVNWGGTGREPVLAQFDRDTLADPAVRDPSTGRWDLRRSNPASALPNPGYLYLPAGRGAKPAAADYNGDGVVDPAVFVSSNGSFWVSYSGQMPILQVLPPALPGARYATPVPSDYDGDGHAETTVYQPWSGNWLTYDYRAQIVRKVAWGWAATEPVPADYDGDGRTDVAVYYARGGTWYILRSRDGNADIRQFGYGSCDPVPADYDGDLIADLAVYDERTGELFVMGSSIGFWRAAVGGPGWKAVRP